MMPTAGSLPQAPTRGVDMDRILGSISKLSVRKSRVPGLDMFEVQEAPYLPDAVRPVVDHKVVDNPAHRDFCRHNPAHRDSCSKLGCGGRLVQNPDKNGMVCNDCGEAPRDSLVMDAAPEYRLHADADAQENQAKIRASEYTAEAEYDRSHFDPREVTNPEWLRIVTNRLNQTMVWLAWLTTSESQPGHLALTADEAATFQDVLRAACLAWVAARKRAGEDAADDADDDADDAAPAADKDKDDKEDFGSPVFWAITIALGVVARRVGGFCVQTAAQAELFTVEALHERLYDRRGATQYTHEQLGNRTQASGSGAAGARVIGKMTKRKARFDSLGNESEQTKKREALNRLILESEVFGKKGTAGPHVLGLSKEVMEKLLPRVMAPFAVPGHMVEPVATEYLDVVVSKRVGLEADLSHVSAPRAAERLGLNARVKQHRAWQKWYWRPFGPAPPRVPGPHPAAPPLRPLTCLRLALAGTNSCRRFARRSRWAARELAWRRR